MFHSARIKLTAWYLLIITLVSFSFSMVIYRALSIELNRVERMHKLRIERRLPNEPPRPFLLDPELIEETESRLKFTLTAINLLILTASAGAGYLLAGKTLRPIKNMVEEQGRFVSDASHELRTPLTSLRSEIEVSLRDRHLTYKEMKKILKSNLEEVDKIQKLTDHLLGLSRYQDGETKIDFTEINLKNNAEKAVAKITPLAKRKKIIIRTKLDDVKMKGHSISLIELCIILLDNAVKYSPSGKKIVITLRKDRKNAILKVRDQGIGIKSSELPYIFNRFYRADSSRNKDKIDGFGLGLSIAKNIAELHHGKITVNSLPGKGSTFIVCLPIS